MLESEPQDTLPPASRPMPFTLRSLLTLAAFCACTAVILSWLYYWAPPLSGNPVVSLPQFHGRDRNAVLADLGQPSLTEKFRVADAGLEIRGGIFRTHPPNDPQHANVAIEELWFRNGRYTTVLWLHEVESQWIVFESIRFHDSVRF